MKHLLAAILLICASIAHAKPSGVACAMYDQNGKTDGSGFYTGPNVKEYDDAEKFENGIRVESGGITETGPDIFHFHAQSNGRQLTVTLKTSEHESVFKGSGNQVSFPLDVYQVRCIYFEYEHSNVNPHWNVPSTVEEFLPAQL